MDGFLELQLRHKRRRGAAALPNCDVIKWDGSHPEKILGYLLNVSVVQKQVKVVFQVEILITDKYLLSSAI